ncbi:ADP compounds hydrolase NudE [Bermanella marisrubri]|uniref:MutT/nudix family protein n=1 Tax=Bermanella marisrubri TaxID=207949 RepID=Q1MYI1_9GAMM|nr:ADP compounds hydrolase NudE [Bermanella marisrubri]EAT11050.1 MutT/nudix family protein [Oceanobacter sp. RED65] [Bermanella marisrubri]QIZ82967.1 ADP compounds hydrolase NudE [Bermanella marisrubri]
MAQKPKLLHSHIIASSRLFTVESMDLEFSNGEQRTYERLVPGGAGAVMMVAINAHQEVMLIKEYGAGIEDYTVTLPKGAVDLGESLSEAANRELKEEIGFGAREITHLKQMSLSPSYMKSGIDVMVALDLYPEQLEGDEPEPLEVLTWPLADIESLVCRTDFTEGRAIAALFMARDWYLKQAI